MIAAGVVLGLIERITPDRFKLAKDICLAGLVTFYVIGSWVVRYRNKAKAGIVNK